MANRADTLNAARSALASGRPEVAEKSLRTLLSYHADNVDARYYLARTLAALGRLEEAVVEFSRLLAARPDHPRAAVQLGIAYSSLGNYRAARTVLEHAQTIDPHSAELHFARGLCQLGSDDLAAAVVSFRSALERNLRIPDVYNNLGAALSRLGQLSEAIHCFRQALELTPGFATAKRNLADCLLRMGDASGAVEAYRDAVVLEPTDPQVHAELGAALRRSNQPEQACAAYARALNLAPDHIAALLGLGLSYADRNDPAVASHRLLAAFERRPDDMETARTVADALERLGLRNQVLEVYERAARSPCASADIREAHGVLLHRLGRLPEALACYEQVLATAPTRRSAQLNRGHALESSGLVSEALACFRGVLEDRPGDRSALAGSASCAFRLCDWESAGGAVGQLLEMPEGIDDLHPFLRLALDIEPEVLAASFARESQAIAARVSQAPAPSFAHGRLRVAYVSPDFRRHPVAYALAGVIRHHDRQFIEAIGVSLTAPDDSDIAVELSSAFEEFLDCAALSDAELVRILRAKEIDIAVDLAGFTSGSRPAIFAARVAPIQVSYLGFPGSSGAGFMDFIIADDIVVPATDAHLYSERIVTLPHSYLPFDRDRYIARAPAQRRDHGLPEDALVLCAFSNGYKISRRMFELWMSLLEAVPDSALWLRSGHAAMQANLLAAARNHGIDACRLIFAPFVTRMDEHLARLQLADLFLDTSPYNAHTTSAEALWAGLPVITSRGRTFAGRVGASLLSAAGLSDLVTASLDEYRDRALHLARTPEALAGIRQRVLAARASAAFDTAGYVRHFESALRRMNQEH